MSFKHLFIRTPCRSFREDAEKLKVSICPNIRVTLLSLRRLKSGIKVHKLTQKYWKTNVLSKTRDMLCCV